MGESLDCHAKYDELNEIPYLESLSLWFLGLYVTGDFLPHLPIPIEKGKIV